MSYQVGCFHRRALGAALLIIAGIAPAAVRAADDSARRFQGGDAIEETVVLGRRQPYRGNVDIDDLPQATSRISAERLNALGITDLQRAMDLVSGVARQNGFGGLWDSFAIRGFAGDENLPSSYLVNGFSAGRGFSGKRDLSNVERLEVIKGPGSALYGRSEPGGTLNIVTKKPGVDSGGYLQVSAGRYDAGRLEGDWSGAPDARVAWRINGAYEEAGSYRDHIDSKKLALTPSALVRLSDDLSLLYELEYSDQEIPFDRGLVVLDGVPRQPVSRFLGEPNDGPMDVDATGHQLTLERRLRDNWLLSVGVGMRRSSLTGWSSDTELSGGRQLLKPDGGTLLSRQRRHRDYDADDLSARVEMSGAAQWLGLRHNLLLGVDAYDYEFHSTGRRWRTNSGSSDATYAIDIHAPVYGYGGTRPDAALQFDRLERQRAEGLYLQNLVELAPDWRLQLGVRLDQFRQSITNLVDDTVSSRQSRSETSPRIGLVHELPDRTQLYLSYSEGFRPNAGANAAGSVFSPEKSDSLEVGVKWRSDRMDGAVALFRTEKSNILSADLDPANSGFSVALGRAESQGVEISLSARLSPDLELNFDYAYVDAETSNEITVPDWEVTLPAGSRLINIPRHAGHLSLTRRGRLAGMPLSAGVSWRYVGERLGETTDQDYDLASYQLLGLFARLELRDDLELRLTLDNAANERYDDNSYHRLWTMPGEPRSWGLSLRQTF